MNTIDILEADIDPFKALGLPFGADSAEIEKAWNALSPESRKSAVLGRAYKMIGSPESREIYMLLSPAPPEDLDNLPREIPRKPRYSGPGIWYRTLAGWLENEDTEKES
jgi:hypothetical protein